MKILDGLGEITEEKAGIIYSIDQITEAILHKIGNLSLVKQIWEDEQEQYRTIEDFLAHVDEKFYLLEVEVNLETEEFLSTCHNVSRLEGYLIKKGIHPLGRTKRMTASERWERLNFTVVKAND